MKKMFLLSTIALFFAAPSFALPPQQKHHKHHHKHHKQMMKHDKDKKKMDKDTKK